MVDIVDKTKRSQMMSGIKGKNTKPELAIRKIVYSLGYRYRLHVKNVAGKPDIVINRLKIAIFINGCFWHKHDCHLFKWPQSKIEFWKEKIGSNVFRDINSKQNLKEHNWKIIIIWECAVKGKTKLKPEDLKEEISLALSSDNTMVEIRGNENKAIS